MNNLYADLRTAIVASLAANYPGLPHDVAGRVEVTPNRDPAHGDMATNAALVIARAARAKPADIAATVTAALATHPAVAHAEAAGPGFVNIRLHPHALRAQLPDILRAGTAYGDSTAGARVAVNIEYVSANPTGPMHIGHCRGAVVGDALANLLDPSAGYTVTQANSMSTMPATRWQALAWAAYWRYLQALGTAADAGREFAAATPGAACNMAAIIWCPSARRWRPRHGAALAGPQSATIAPAATQWLETVRDFTIGRVAGWHTRGSGAARRHA